MLQFRFWLTNLQVIIFKDTPNMAENIKVVCRVRPLNNSELTGGSKSIINILNDNTLSISSNSEVCFNSNFYNFDNIFINYSIITI